MNKTEKNNLAYKTKAQDKTGVLWDLEVYIELDIDKSKTNKNYWKSSLEIKTILNKDLLLRSGSLTLKDNSRVLDLLGTNSIKIRKCLKQVKTSTESDGYKRMINEIPLYIDKLKKNSLQEFKYQVALESIKKQRWYSAPSAFSNNIKFI